MRSIERVRELVQRYNNTYHHPSLRPLALSDIYSLFPDTKNPTSVTLGWPATWPCAGDPGVYLIFDCDMSLLYVGKASLNHTLGGRLSSYFQYARDGSRGCEVLGTWSARPVFVVTIAVDSDKAFEAPALEEYLIGELQPPDNTRGIRTAI
jgi:hypothetical protein